jgi:hypothetical protein
MSHFLLYLLDFVGIVGQIITSVAQVTSQSTMKSISSIRRLLFGNCRLTLLYPMCFRAPCSVVSHQSVAVVVQAVITARG